MKQKRYTIQRKKLFVAATVLLTTIMVVNSFVIDSGKLKLISDFEPHVPVILLPFACLFVGFGCAIVMQISDFGSLVFFPVMVFCAATVSTAASIIVYVICLFTDAGTGQQWWAPTLMSASGLLGICLSGRIEWGGHEAGPTDRAP